MAPSSHSEVPPGQRRFLEIRSRTSQQNVKRGLTLLFNRECLPVGRRAERNAIAAPRAWLRANPNVNKR
jgi:hypothetical protein